SGNLTPLLDPRPRALSARRLEELDATSLPHRGVAHRRRSERLGRLHGFCECNSPSRMDLEGMPAGFYWTSATSIQFETLGDDPALSRRVCRPRPGPPGHGLRPVDFPSKKPSANPWLLAGVAGDLLSALARQRSGATELLQSPRTGADLCIIRDGDG